MAAGWLIHASPLANLFCIWRPLPNFRFTALSHDLFFLQLKQNQTKQQLKKKNSPFKKKYIVDFSFFFFWIFKIFFPSSFSFSFLLVVEFRLEFRFLFGIFFFIFSFLFNVRERNCPYYFIYSPHGSRQGIKTFRRIRPDCWNRNVANSMGWICWMGFVSLFHPSRTIGKGSAEDGQIKGQSFNNAASRDHPQTPLAICGEPSHEMIIFFSNQWPQYRWHVNNLNESNGFHDEDGRP